LAAQLEKEGVCVFADGAGIGGGVGGAARIRTPAGTIIMTQHIGSADRHLSVEGELLGTILALKIAQTIPSLTRVTILSDCQQAIRELLDERPTRHRSLVERFYRELWCTPSLKQIRLVWVPGHDGVEMNELVDGDAKAAARGESRTTIISGGFQMYLPTPWKFV
jgi:ribonuclease HI